MAVVLAISAGFVTTLASANDSSKDHETIVPPVITSAVPSPGAVLLSWLPFTGDDDAGSTPTYVVDVYDATGTTLLRSDAS